jgi:hypothetical protein
MFNADLLNSLLMRVMQFIQLSVNPVQFNIFVKTGLQIIDRSYLAAGLTNARHHQMLQYLIVNPGKACQRWFGVLSPSMKIIACQ